MMFANYLALEHAHFIHTWTEPRELYTCAAGRPKFLSLQRPPPPPFGRRRPFRRLLICQIEGELELGAASGQIFKGPRCRDLCNCLVLCVLAPDFTDRLASSRSVTLPLTDHTPCLNSLRTGTNRMPAPPPPRHTIPVMRNHDKLDQRRALLQNASKSKCGTRASNLAHPQRSHHLDVHRATIVPPSSETLCHQF
eukprot:COSAG06_NODE_2266_length_7209_cov_1.865139_6_plen_195_part_00